MFIYIERKKKKVYLYRKNKEKSLFIQKEKRKKFIYIEKNKVHNIHNINMHQCVDGLVGKERGIFQSGGEPAEEHRKPAEQHSPGASGPFSQPGMTFTLTSIIHSSFLLNLLN